MRMGGLVSLVGACSLLALTAARDTGSAPSGVGSSAQPTGVLVFADYRGSSAARVGEGVPGLYLIEADGSSRRPLRGRFYLGTEPDWSPDGQRIAYARWRDTEDARSVRWGADIVVAAATGAAAKVLIEYSDEWSWPGNPQWSPDGRRIAFVNTGPNHGNRIFVTDLKLEPFKTGRAVPGSDDAGLVGWAPSGDELLLAFPAGIYRIPVKGGTPRLLLRQASAAAWSPDGRRLAYVADRGGLYLLDLQTRSSRLVTHTCADVLPEWSPDGRWLAFADCGHPPVPNADSPRHDLVVVRADGTGRRVIFTSRAGIGTPSWR